MIHVKKNGSTNLRLTHIEPNDQKSVFLIQDGGRFRCLIGDGKVSDWPELKIGNSPKLWSFDFKTPFERPYIVVANGVLNDETLNRFRVHFHNMKEIHKTTMFTVSPYPFVIYDTITKK